VRAAVAAAVWALAACAPQRLPDPAAFEAPDVAAIDTGSSAQPETADAPDSTGKDGALPAIDSGDVGDAAAAQDLAGDAGSIGDGVDAQPDAASSDDGGGPADVGGESIGDGGADGDTGGDAVPGPDGDVGFDEGVDSGIAGDGQGDAAPFMPMDATACADPLAPPGDCTECAAGFVAVATALGSVCAADFPLWGPRPDAPPQAWFSDSGKGTIADSHSGRTWAKEPSPVPVTWVAANGYCAGLAIGGHSDWRLPTLAELLTIRDTTSSAPTVVVALANTPKEFVWTASPVAGATEPSYWTVLFNGGFTAFSAASAKCRARCVR